MGNDRGNSALLDSCMEWRGRNCTWLVHILAMMLFLLLGGYASASYAGKPSKPPFPNVFPVNGPTIACVASPDTVNCPSKKRSNYEINDTGIKQMYEQSVEDPCFVNGTTSPCSANNYFKPQIRMNIRYCLGVPMPVPYTKACWRNFGAKFFSGSHDCWKLVCAGGQMSGSKNLGIGECDFIKGVRFCARVATSGYDSDGKPSIQYGNRTGVDPDYRPAGGGSPYPTEASDPAATFTLTNGKEITIVNTTESRNVPSDSPYGSNRTVEIGTSKVVDYKGNMSDLAAKVVYVVPEDTLLIKGRQVDNAQPIYLKQVGSEYVVVTPRMQLCAYEDPMDINDLMPKYQLLHFMTPGAPFTVDPFKSVNFIIGLGDSVAPGLGAAVGAYIYTSMALSILTGTGGTGILLMLAASIILAAIQTHINYWVQQDEGCINLTLAPFPPPYQTTITNPIPTGSVQAICSQSQRQTAHNCVAAKTAGQYDSFTKPLIRIGFNSVIPICENGQQSTNDIPCVTISEQTLTDAEIENIKDQIDNMIDPISGESLPRPTQLRPYYSLSSIDPITHEEKYSITGVMTGDYADLAFTFQQDPVSKDYPSGQNTMVSLKDPRSGPTHPYVDRKFFNCLADEGKSICGYELLKTPNSTSASGTTPYPCQYVNDRAYVKPLSCVARQPVLAPVITRTEINNPSKGLNNDDRAHLYVSFPTCENESNARAQNPNCSAHAIPLLQASISEGSESETVIFGTSDEDYIDEIIAAHGSVNPIRNNPIVNEATGQHYTDGGYARCRYLYGIKFCTDIYDIYGNNDPVQYQTDSNGDFITDGQGNPIYQSGIVSDYSGYLYGGGKLCLGGYTPPDALVLAAKVTGKDYANDISTAADDILVAPYVDGQVIVYREMADAEGVMHPSKHSPRQPAVDADGKTDTSGTVINNQTEGLREYTPVELGMCVDIPPPIPCPEILYTKDPATNWKSTAETDNDGNADWSRTVPSIITTSGGTTTSTVNGTCRPGWYGAPTRTCTVVQGVGGAQSIATWGPVTNACQIQTCEQTGGYDSGGYDCHTWDAQTAFNANKNTCSRERELASTLHEKAYLCCEPSDPSSIHGVWDGSHRDRLPAKSSCNWTEQGRQPCRCGTSSCYGVGCPTP